MGEWISVKDRDPEIPCLIWYGDTVELAHTIHTFAFNDGTKRFSHMSPKQIPIF